MSWPCSRISSSPWAGRGSDWPAATATGNLHPLLEDLFLEGIYWFKVLLEVSLIVPDFTLSVYGSSCHSLFFRLILILFSSFSSYFLASHSALGMPKNRKRKQRSENEAEFFFCMNCCTQKCQNLKLFDSPLLLQALNFHGCFNFSKLMHFLCLKFIYIC